MLTSPVSANVFVPLDVSVPIFANQSAPLRTITGTFASVSTLLINVGLPNKPLFAGNGGFGLGIPLSPSIDAIKAVSSPHTKAPAPSFMWISSEKLLPIIFFPKKFLSSASFMAFLKRLMARGYSALTYI